MNNQPSPLTPHELRLINDYWRACTYLAAGMIYLRDNPLLREPLSHGHVKRRLLGHWGSSPGLSFIYIHMNRLIRKYGYRGTPATLAATKAHAELQNNLSAAAHLIHGSSEGRFSITYCPGHLSQQEIESVNFQYADLAAMTQRYHPDKLKDGWNTLPDGEKIFYISNPALGLWACRSRFEK